MPTPRQHVHGEQRRLGKLQEKRSSPRGICSMGAGSVAAGQDVETVQADPDQIMINKLDDPPGVAVVVHEAAPGRGLVRDPHGVALRKITEPAELAGEELIIVDGRCTDVAADKDGVDAEPLHERGDHATLRRPTKSGQRADAEQQWCEVGRSLAPCDRLCGHWLSRQSLRQPRVLRLAPFDCNRAADHEQREQQGRQI